MRLGKAAKVAPAPTGNDLRDLVLLSERNGFEATAARNLPQGRPGAARFVHAIAADPANRHFCDLYVTPRPAIDALLNVEPIDAPVWDPCCGTGAISEALIERGIPVHSTDLFDHGFGEAGIDFLFCQRPDFAFNAIVMNPPFKAAREFVERALLLDCEKVVALTRLAWLEGGRRRRLFESSPLARVWVHSSRQNVSRAGADYGHGGMVAFCWMVWQRGHIGRPELGWLP